MPPPDAFERCYCTGVLKPAVVAAIRVGKCTTVDALRRATGVCCGCQTCRPEIEALLVQERERAGRSDLGTHIIPRPE
ncbi:MAG: (2Fe-2S)-binding protein [Planctomycetes bacterium]|nr:(2Fe-2S)-binding protein [Planctomycetota bacterium]